MSDTMDVMEDVRCDFDGCDSSMIFRVLLAVVDQLCADGDVDLAALESLDIPLEDCIDALHHRGVQAAVVTSRGNLLVIELRLETGAGLADDGASLGDVSEIVESFFDVTISKDPASVRLAARLG
ncbi:hypothetical protein [Ilumatobacter sp.]|uniref:hypothetical protein n=1 Tax=Ilumatobacter sp. TaxID=1967498 RepID=UPI003C588258